MLKLLAFLIGLVVGGIVGTLVVGFLAPVPGEETRRKLRNLVVPPPVDIDGVQIGVQNLALSPSVIKDAWRQRFATALEAASRVRDERTKELIHAFHEAQRTGKSAPLV